MYLTLVKIDEAVFWLFKGKWALSDMGHMIEAGQYEDWECKLYGWSPSVDFSVVSEYALDLRRRTFRCARILPAPTIRARLLLVEILLGVEPPHG